MKINDELYERKAKYDLLTSKKCKCGHVITFKNPLEICKYCGTLHFINKRAEFNYKIKRRFAK